MTDELYGTGAATMARRRIEVLGEKYVHTRVVMRGVAGPSTLRSGSLASELALARADVVVTTSELTLMSVAPRLQTASRLVHFLHEPAASALARMRLMRLLHLATQLVVTPAESVDRVAAAVGLPPSRITVLPDFVPGHDALRSPAAADVILGVGRVFHGSGTAELVDGFGLVAGDLPGWQLRLVGARLHRVDEAVDAAGLRSRVLPLRTRPGLGDVYVDAGIVARVGSSDAWGLPVLEGLAAGVPVLASADVPAAQLHIRDGVNGRVLERTDPQEIADALLAMVRDRETLADGARAAAGSVSDPDAAARTRALFEQVLDTAAVRTDENLTDVEQDAKESE